MNLRSGMPKTTEWIDSLRSAFGKAGIDASIKAGMNGVPGAFYARENGIEVGTPARPAPAGKEIDGTQRVLESINPFRKDVKR